MSTFPMHPYPMTPSHPTTPGTHQAARHRKCRSARLTPEHSAIAGTFWTEIIFATCHTLSLFTFPGSRDALCRVRGEGRVAPAACAHSRSHSPALTLARAPPAQPRWACVCTRPGEAGPARPPPPSPLAPSSSRAWAQLRTLSLLHALLSSELGSSCHAKLGKFDPTCNSGDTTHGRSSLLRVTQPQVSPLPQDGADFSL